MKLSVSNIAWKNFEFNKFYELISALNCKGVEIAPSKLWKNYPKINNDEKLLFLKDIKKFNLEFLGFHSLLFGREDLQIFKDNNSRESTKKFIFDLIELCAELKGKNLIFGSPNNRNTFKNSNAEEIGKAFFYEVSDYAKKFGIFICIEPLDSSMTDFLNSINETGDFIQNVGNPYLKLHIDTKSFLISSENIEESIQKYSKLINHVHISDKNLNILKDDKQIHKQFAMSLNKINYNKYLSLEMKQNKDNEVKSIKDSISFIKENYF